MPWLRYSRRFGSVGCRKHWGLLNMSVVNLFVWLIAVLTSWAVVEAGQDVSRLRAKTVPVVRSTLAEQGVGGTEARLDDALPGALVWLWTRLVAGIGLQVNLRSAARRSAGACRDASCRSRGGSRLRSSKASNGKDGEPSVLHDYCF